MTIGASRYSGRPVVVTGCAGFIGSHLSAALLDAGAQVTGIDAFTDYYDPAIKRSRGARLVGREGFRLVESDLRSLDLAPVLAGAAAVFHLAAQPGVRASWGPEFTVYTERNVLALQHLLEALKERGESAPRLVFASSSSVYGDAESLPTPEEAVRRPISPYGVTKSVGEDLLRVYRRTYGIPCVALRYFTVYGPGQRPDMAFQRLLVAARRGGTFTVFGDGSQERDVTYVADVVDATLAAGMAERVDGEVLNIGGGRMVSLKDVLEFVRSFAVPEFRLVFAAAEKGDARATGASIAKAASLLGYSPRVGWREGITAQAEAL